MANLGRCIAVTALVLAACGDVTNVTVVQEDGGSRDDADVSANASDASSSEASVEVDAGASDAALDGPLAVDPFENTAPFSGCQPPTQTSAAAGHGGNAPLAGSACLECHKSGGVAKNRFVFAGTVVHTSSGAAVAGAEVVVRNPQTEQLYSACSDDYGNFWYANAGTMPAEAAVGVRTASGSARQLTVVTSGDCNGCHNAGARIHVP